MQYDTPKQSSSSSTSFVGTGKQGEDTTKQYNERIAPKLSQSLHALPSHSNNFSTYLPWGDMRDKYLPKFQSVKNKESFKAKSFQYLKAFVILLEQRTPGNRQNYINLRDTFQQLRTQCNEDYQTYKGRKQFQEKNFISRFFLNLFGYGKQTLSNDELEEYEQLSILSGCLWEMDKEIRPQYRKSYGLNPQCENVLVRYQNILKTYQDLDYTKPILKQLDLVVDNYGFWNKQETQRQLSTLVLLLNTLYNKFEQSEQEYKKRNLFVRLFSSYPLSSKEKILKTILAKFIENLGIIRQVI